jgi:predicted Zn-dependent protease
MTVLIENANMLNNLSFSREAELEADNEAITTLDKNGINPNGKLKLMRILNGITSDYGGMDFLSTHHATEKRIENAEAKIIAKKYAEKTYTENVELKRIFEEMVSGGKL